MKYTRYETESDITLVPAPQVAGATRGIVRGTVIVLHGLGADGTDFVPVVDELRLPDTLPLRFVFPHAPVRSVTVNNGYRMRAWYDIRDFTITGREDLEGMTEAADRVRAYVEREEREHGVPPGNVMLAGFSQGGAVVLHAGIRSPVPLAGIVAMSTYLPFRARVGAEVSQTNREVPILMCHGTRDPVVSVELGQLARDTLKEHGYEVEWHAYPMGHEVSLAEIAHVADWIRKRYA